MLLIFFSGPPGLPGASGLPGMAGKDGMPGLPGAKGERAIGQTGNCVHVSLDDTHAVPIVQVSRERLVNRVFRDPLAFLAHLAIVDHQATMVRNRTPIFSHVIVRHSRSIWCTWRTSKPFSR